MQTKAENISELLDSPFATVKDFNVGIVFIGIYILMDFGSISGLFPVLNYTLRLPFIIASGSILYAIYLVLTRRTDFKSPTTKIFTIMCLFIVLYAAIATKLPIVRNGVIKSFFFYLAMYLIFISSVKSTSQFILIIDIWLASVAFSSYHGIMQGGLVWGNNWLADENEIALLAAMAVPFAFILFLEYKSKIKKTCYLICLVLYITVSVVGYSRGGMLSMAGAAFFCWILLKKKVRMLLMMIIALFLIINLAPAIYFEEMATLQSGTEESTAESRIYFWKKGAEMLYDNPFFGVGPQNYPYFFPIYDNGERYLEPEMRHPHSFPVQWIAEMGIVGLG
ncbi:MAG: O-antigen ligase family protein, partial [Ignavibacteria bacterium]|nr:O-antigen ligase family protein [Ignavibacteria bacterium]